MAGTLGRQQQQQPPNPQLQGHQTHSFAWFLSPQHQVAGSGQLGLVDLIFCLLWWPWLWGKNGGTEVTSSMLTFGSHTTSWAQVLNAWGL